MSRLHIWSLSEGVSYPAVQLWRETRHYYGKCGAKWLFSRIPGFLPIIHMICGYEKAEIFRKENRRENL